MARGHQKKNQVIETSTVTGEFFLHKGASLHHEYTIQVAFITNTKLLKMHLTKYTKCHSLFSSSHEMESSDALQT